MSFQRKSGLIVLACVILGWALPCFGQTPAPGVAGEQPTGARVYGSIRGTVVDQSGAMVAGARVKLAGDNQTLNQETLSDNDGRFSFENIAPGSFQITVTWAGFAMQAASGTLHTGENFVVPQIVLAVAGNMSEVQVGLSQTDVAEEQIKIEETQRVLGFVPNFYVSYIPDAAPLTARQKFKLAAKTVVDPVTFVMVGGAAGIEQAQNHFKEYGQGAQGYGKRFGAGYADTVSGAFIGSAILPSLLKQDPRYFYKGTGSKGSRFFYAIANAVICKGDNKSWQPNYSNVLGSLAAGGISNLYYPRQDRDGMGLTFENAAIGIGATAISNLLQEFVIRRLTPKVPNNASPKP
ncbi:MAG: carboxypeptidase-like regulatory domain-containing protein [Terriglobales bacterium]